jgi:NAD(P)H-flavin reductase
VEENIISDIIEIDEMAKDKLSDADKKRVQIIATAKSEKDEIINDKLKKTNEKLSAVEKSESQKAAEREAEITENRDAEIKRLDDIFVQKSDKWVEEIVAAIINS